MLKKLPNQPRHKQAGLLLLFFVIAFSQQAFSAPRCEDCKRDKYDRIHRSHSAKSDFKQQQPCPSTGKQKGKCPGYVIDHIKAIKRGGADKPGNMQWQTTAEAKAKDKWE